MYNKAQLCIIIIKVQRYVPGPVINLNPSTTRSPLSYKNQKKNIKIGSAIVQVLRENGTYRRNYTTFKRQCTEKLKNMPT